MGERTSVLEPHGTAKAPDSQSDGVEQLTDEALADLYFQERRSQDLEALIQRNQVFAYRVAVGVCGNSALAEEAVQDAFLHLIQQAKGFRDQGGASFRGWLYRWVVNAASVSRRTEHRIRKREQFMRYGNHEPKGEAIESGGVETSGEEKHEALENLRQALCGLSRDLRMPLILHFQEGLSQSDVGRMMGVSQPQVSRRINEGLEALRRQLAVGSVGASMIVLPDLLLQKSLLDVPSAFGENLLQVCGHQARNAALKVSRRLSSKVTASSAYKGAWVIAGIACVAAALTAIAWLFQSKQQVETNAKPLPPAATPAPSAAPLSAPAAPTLDRMWDFSQGPDNDLTPVYGSWIWSRLDPTRAGMVAPKDDSVNIVLPVKIPASPLLITIRTKLNELNVTAKAGACWAEPNGTIPNRAHYRRSLTPTPQRIPVHVHVIYLLEGYGIELQPDGNVGAIREFASLIRPTRSASISRTESYSISESRPCGLKKSLRNSAIRPRS
ncbi:MAG: sigma-70 family RNA polymerase sigma factor [Planctomycetes bacterium]|nr:sigma-70 family RNA polymerase sigma factor [Planctomycetota bacterium]